MTRPGARLRILARRIFNDSIVERFVDPAIADLQHEHEQAIRRGHEWRARRIRLAGYCAFWKLAVIVAAREAIHERTAADDRDVRRTIVFSLVAIMGLTVLLLWGPLNGFRHRGWPGMASLPRLVLYLLPQALLITLPIGLMFGIFSGLPGGTMTARVTRSMSALVIVCFILTFILAAWAMPAANQAFRELMAGHRLATRGFNEMTLLELARTPAQNIWIVSATANRLAFEFHFRLALPFAALALGPFAMAVAAASRGPYRARRVLLIGVPTSIAYYALLFWARQAGDVADQHAKVVVAWLPNLVFFGLTLLLFSRRLFNRTRCM
jgi:lipopolysaccharide export LptBFGC system permease protein LptF